jgi:hypothetical protein
VDTATSRLAPATMIALTPSLRNSGKLPAMLQPITLESPLEFRQGPSTRITLFWKGIGFGWPLSKATSIDANM